MEVSVGICGALPAFLMFQIKDERQWQTRDKWKTHDIFAVAIRALFLNPLD